MHETGHGEARASRAGTRWARSGAVALAATLILPASWLLALPASASQPTASHAFAGPPPAMGHFSKINVPGGKQLQAEGISDSGVIVGCYEAKTSVRSFIDKHGKISTFADPAAKGRGAVTCAFGIDDAGVIVGYYRSPNSAEHGFVLRNGRFRSITAPGAGKRDGQGTFAIGINRSGVIVGDYITGRASTARGFVLKNGEFRTVRVPLSQHSHPLARVVDGIADDGTIAGVVTDAKHNVHSFIERAGKFTIVAVPHGFETELQCLSEHGGFAVGNFQPTPKASTTQIGFTYANGIYHSLRDPSAPRHTIPQCGNAAGFVVGYLANATGIPSQAFLFTPTKVTE